jgi:hypothetical protein
MHVDILPFAPFSGARPWLLVVSVDTLHLACIAAGIMGVGGLLVLRWLQLRANARDSIER